VKSFDLRLTAAIAAGKLAGFASRSLHAGGGTNLPGSIARRVHATTLQDLSVRLPQGIVLIAGTNGKTTTARMLAGLLSASGQRVLHNRAGANLLTGLTATALAGASLTGRPAATVGFFETDEAALPGAIAETQPRLVVLHNLFRDQLDRYGEVDTIARNWRGALETLPASATVLLNADDPAVADLGADLTCRVCFYGLEDTRHADATARHAADSQFCRRCGAPYQYRALFYAHIGQYACPVCGHQRPTPDYRLARLDLQGTMASRLFLTYPGGALELQLPLPGRYNALNALAATAAALLLDVSPAVVRGTLEQFSAAFGRLERVQTEHHSLFLALIKNPVGASETLRMLVGDTADGSVSAGQLALLIIINDRHADGTDVSWLWDAEFESLADRAGQVVVSGTRASDMAVRLKYAGVMPERMIVEPDVVAALDLALARLAPGLTLYVLPTYTAMLALRAELARRGWVRPFWQD